MTNTFLRLISHSELGLDLDFSLNTFEVRLRRFDLETASFLCGALNQIVCNRLHSNLMESQMFVAEVLELKESTRNKAKALIPKGLPLLSRSQLMELIKNFALYGRDNDQADILVKPNDFLIAAIYGGELATADWPVDALTKKDGQSPRERMKNALPALRRMALFTEHLSDPFLSLARLKRLVLDKAFKETKMKEAFQANAGMTIDEFLDAAMAVVISGVKHKFLMQSKVIDQSEFNFAAQSLYKEVPQIKEISEAFLAEFSISPAEYGAFLREQTDKSPGNLGLFKPLRERPIFRSRIGSYTILDLGFFLQAVEVGPIFKVMLNGKYSAQAALAKFGDAFEEYCQELIEEHHSTAKIPSIVSKNPAITNDTLKKTRELSDIVLLSGSDLVLIECKAVWLKDEYLSSELHIEFWEHVMKKLGVSVSGSASKEERKGIAQLSDSIELLAEPQTICTDSSIELNKIKNIFPVLLVHDHSLSATGFANMLASEFACLLGLPDFSESGSFHYKNLEIFNLTLMTIEELEWLVSTASALNYSEHIRRLTAKDPSRVHKSVADYLYDDLGNISRSKNPLFALSKELIKSATIRFFPDKQPQLE